jgi:hypothetical protein
MRNYLDSFGEIAMVRPPTKIQAKLDDEAFLAIFLSLTEVQKHYAFIF